MPTADEAVEQLARVAKLDQAEGARLVARVLELRPEVVEPGAEDAEFQRQVRNVLGSNRPGLDVLAQALAMRTSDQTAERVIDAVIGGKAIQSSSNTAGIVDFLLVSWKRRLIGKLTPDEGLFIADCLVQLWTPEENTPSRLKAERLLESFSEEDDVLIEILNGVRRIELASGMMPAAATSDGSKRWTRSRALRQWAAIQWPYVDFPDDPFAAVKLVEGERRSRGALEREAYYRVLQLFGALDNLSALYEQIDALTQMVVRQPQVVVQQLGMIAALALALPDASSVKIRDGGVRPLLQWIVATGIELVANTQARDAPHIASIVHTLFDFLAKHETRGASRQNEANLALGEALLRLCRRFAEVHEQPAKELLVECADRLRALARLFPSHVAARQLLDMLDAQAQAAATAAAAAGATSK